MTKETGRMRSKQGGKQHGPSLETCGKEQDQVLHKNVLKIIIIGREKPDKHRPPQHTNLPISNETKGQCHRR